MDRQIQLPEEAELYELSEFLRIFSDPTRLKILFALKQEPTCVTELADSIGMSQSAVSHQLAIMRRADLIRADRSGKNIVYSISDDHVSLIIEMALAHTRETDI